MMRAFKKDQNSVGQEEIGELARQIIDACDADFGMDVDKTDVGSDELFSSSANYVSFHLFPKASSFEVLAQLALIPSNNSTNIIGNSSLFVVATNFLQAGLHFPIGYREREYSLFNAAFYMTSFTCEISLIRTLVTKAKQAQLESAWLMYGEGAGELVKCPNQISVETYLKRHSKKSDDSLINGGQSGTGGEENVGAEVLDIIKRYTAQEKRRKIWS
jgi:hypothetical protein